MPHQAADTGFAVQSRTRLTACSRPSVRQLGCYRSWDGGGRLRRMAAQRTASRGSRGRLVLTLTLQSKGSSMRLRRAGAQPGPLLRQRCARAVNCCLPGQQSSLEFLSVIQDVAISRRE